MVRACFGFLTLVKISCIVVLDETDTDSRIVANDVLVTVQANPARFAVQAPTVGVISDGK